MGRLFLPSDHRNLDLFETRAFEPLVQIALRKAKPGITIQSLACSKLCLSKSRIMICPPGLQHVVRSCDRARGCLRMMQSLAQDQIDTLFVDGGSSRSPRRNSRFLRPFFFALLAPNATIFRSCRRDDSLGPTSEQLAQQTLPPHKVRHGERRQHAQSNWPNACQERPGP